MKYFRSFNNQFTQTQELPDNEQMINQEATGAGKKLDLTLSTVQTALV